MSGFAERSSRALWLAEDADRGESSSSLPARVSVDLPVAHFALDIASRAALAWVANNQQGHENNPDNRGDDDQGIHACGLPPASCPETRFFAGRFLRGTLVYTLMLASRRACP